MARKKQVDEVVDVDLNTLQEDADPILPAPRVVKMTDPDWHDYVMSQFEADELDNEGHPFVFGLRRVARAVLGPILNSTAKVVQSPYFEGGILQPAVVEYTVTFLWTQLEQGQEGAYPVTYSDCADVYYGNTDAEFVRYSTATAATRSEGRCLRKALGLKRVIAAEEKSGVPIDDVGANGAITPTQITFIDTLCKRLNIDVVEFINMGKDKYGSIADVSFGRAVKMVEYLGKIQNNPDLMPKLSTYNPNWKR